MLPAGVSELLPEGFLKVVLEGSALKKFKQRVPTYKHLSRKLDLSLPEKLY